MMNIWGMTDIGLVRRENQDAYAVRISEETGFTICVVCDGMGGPGGGKLASELAVEAFLSACLANLCSDADDDQVAEVAASAVAAANTAPGVVLWPTNLSLCVLAAAELTAYAMTPSDLLGRLPAAFKELEE